MLQLSHRWECNLQPLSFVGRLKVLLKEVNMKSKRLRRIGGLILAALLLPGVVLVSSDTAEAQSRRRIIVVRPSPYRFYHRNWWGRDPWGYNRWGYDPWSPYGFRYRQYVFDNREEALSKAYKQGFKTGKDDGKKAKSYSPERSHYYKEAGFGNFGEVYRVGFSRGYREGYRVGYNGRAG